MYIAMAGPVHADSMQPGVTIITIIHIDSGIYFSINSSHASHMFSRCFHGMPIHISSSSRPSTTLHIGWVPSRKGSLMLRIWNENAKPWKASLRNSDAWRSVDRIFFRWIQMWNTLGNFVQKYVLIFDYLFVVWALISPCVALLILFVVCKRISVERLWVTY